MPYRNGNIVWNATNWTPEMISFLKGNFSKMTNRQLASHLSLRLTTTRTMCYKLGLKRMEMEYFTEDQIKFLRENYKHIGDVELAEIFEAKWPKNKKWTKQHMEKKRKYLGLKRTEKQIIAIGQRNIDQGRLNSHMKGKTNWLTTGPAKQKEIRMYRNIYGVIQARIKIGKRWVFWPRWAWKQKYGEIPDGFVVVMKDDNPFHTRVSNLELITRSAAASRYVAKSGLLLTDNFVISQSTYGNPEAREILRTQPEMIENFRTVMLLKRSIKKAKYESGKHKTRRLVA